MAGPGRARGATNGHGGVSMDTGVLFSGVITDADGEITAGPEDFHLVAPDTVLAAGTTLALGGIVMENGQSLRGEADAANSVSVIAYGFEEVVA